MTYAELLDHLKAFPPSDKAVEAFLRLYFQETGIVLPGNMGAHSIQFDMDAEVAVAPGQLAWNFDEDTLDLGMENAVLQLGLEMLYHAQNDSGVDIPDGRPVMFTGRVGNSGRGTIELMDASTTDNRFAFLGLCTETFLDGTVGKVTRFGRVRGINSSGSGLNKLSFADEVWADGDTIYCDAVNTGFLTNVKPTSPAMALVCGWVLSPHATNGTIFCRATNQNETAAWGDIDGGNFVEFNEGTSEFHFHGAASIVLDNLAGKGIKVDTDTPDYGWHDMIGVIDTRGFGGAEPGFNIYNGSLRQHQFGVGDEVFNDFHVPHDYAPGTDLYLHIHWSHIEAALASGGVTWEFEVHYAKGHDQAPFIFKTISVQQDANLTQFQHMIAEVQITNDGGDATHHDRNAVEIDGLFMVRTKLTGNTLSSGTPFGHFIDIHYQSTGVTSKNKAPNFYT